MTEDGISPDASTPKPAEAEFTEAGEVTRELTPTSEPPPGTIIPPMEGMEPTPPVEGESTVYKSIWIPLGIAFLLGAVIGSGVLVLTGRTPSIRPAISSEQNPQPPPPQESVPGMTQITPDYGVGSHLDEQSNGRGIAVSRILAAKQNIVWIANYPTDPSILTALAQKKAEGLPILIVSGKDTNPESMRPAKNMGLALARSKISLEEPQSILMLDSNYIIDISRDRTIWESIDPKVVNEANKWAAKIIEYSEPIH